jgi:hypothetical protein
MVLTEIGILIVSSEPQLSNKPGAITVIVFDNVTFIKLLHLQNVA